MKLFNYTVDIYRVDTPESIRRDKIKNFKLNAIKGLIDAELQLELNREQYRLAIKEEPKDKEEVSRLWDAIEFQAKSIKNYKSQLAVLNKQ